MFELVPDLLPTNAPVVVVLHGCFASATLYDDETGWPMLAERWGVALVFPEQTVANDPTKCFRFWDPANNTRGRGEALSIKQMVDWMHVNRGTDSKRVFIMGHSGGGLFTSVMLATYPDVFRAGAIVAGGPYGCGNEGAVAVGLDGNRSPVRGGKCVDGSVVKTPSEWGDLARSGYPGYLGRKPIVSIWHGTADTMVSPKNLTELVKQWTNVHGTDQVPEVIDTVKGYPHKVYEDGAGGAVVESYELTGQSHGWPIDPGGGDDQCNGRLPSWNAGICAAYYAGRWFGLDQPADTTPPEITPNTSGTLGANSWYVSNVTVSWTVTDPDAPVQSTSGCETQTVTTDTSGTTFTCIATSAGGTSSESVTIKRDATAPTIRIWAPENGAAYLLNDAAPATYECADATSGVTVCTGTVPTGTSFDTASVGAKHFPVSAQDGAGNTAEAASAYRVEYAPPGSDCLGAAGHTALAPIRADGSSVFRQGSSVPVKFRVCDVFGTSIGTPGVVSGFELVDAATGTGTPDVNQEASSSPADSSFRWDPAQQQWVLNLGTNNLAKDATYQYRIALDDGTTISFQFGLK